MYKRHAYTLLTKIYILPILIKIFYLSCNRIEPLEECNKEEVQKIQENLHVFKGIIQLSLNECHLSLQTVKFYIYLKKFKFSKFFR